MKIYALAKVSNECYGHGDFGNENRICRMGAYGMGEFPPVFTSKEDAERVVKEDPQFAELVVVELNLYSKIKG